MFFVGALFVILFPGLSSRAADTIGRDPLRSLGLGLAVLVCVPFVAVVLLITIIGIPLALLLISLAYPSDTDTPGFVNESQYYPVELVGMLSTLKFSPYPPKMVAERILKGIEKKKEVISTDTGNKALYAIVHYLNLGYPFQDFLLNRALKKLGKRKSCND